MWCNKVGFKIVNTAGAINQGVEGVKTITEIHGNTHTVLASEEKISTWKLSDQDLRTFNKVFVHSPIR